jgi:uncharacterized Fe-S radical SAM superfamily protein PflX
MRSVSVPRRRAPRNYRSASKTELTKIFFTSYPLEELFDEEDLEDLLVVTKRRIIAEFFFATDRYRGRYISTDNYIIGVDGRLSDLASYVTRKMRRHIVRPWDLPGHIQELSPKIIDRIIARTEYELILNVLQDIRHHEIWYDEARGIWQASQTSLDEYLETKRIARNIKRDDRSYHGRVRSQSKARGIPAGTSIGTA